ncbi:PRC-barrel domain-containing protein [Paraburkholderia phosphatilytica]|uniref:PRC-barrel domain-containing protein n=1 Tax=Paraburkholderia phosphatilytica TaxID=2282883 RepID=UPI000E52DD14|nr:PRC-barrel domain-containing protein [Paraburkholderia phosphatilytica]
MRRGPSRPVTLSRHLLLMLFVALAATLSGCGLFEEPEREPAPIVTANVEAVTSPVAQPPETAASEPEEEETSKPAPAKKPKKPVVRRPPPPTPPPAPASAPPAPPPAPLITTRDLDRNSVRALLDSQVKKPDGKVVGRAVDMIADASGKPQQIVVNLQGFMGIGDRKVTFPWSAIRVAPAAKPAPITLDPAPSQLPKPDRPKPVPQPGNTPPSSPNEPLRLPIIDSTVERPNGAEVGRVVDVLLDANAQPQAVVLDVSGILSQERRAIAANWSALHFTTRDRALHAQVDLSDAAIKASPPYSADQPVRAVSPAPPPAPPPAAAAPPASAAPVTKTASNPSASR